MKIANSALQFGKECLYLPRLTGWMNCQLSIVNCQLNLSALGIGEEHYEAIEKACKALEKQGVKVELTK